MRRSWWAGIVFVNGVQQKRKASKARSDLKLPEVSGLAITTRLGSV